MDHLSPAARTVIDAPAAERLAFMRKPKWFGYASADAMIEKLESLLVYPDTHRTPGAQILGDSNSGKSAVAQEFLLRHPLDPNLDGDSVVMPVVYIEMPAGPDIGLFYEEILLTLGQPFRAKDSVASKKHQVISTLTSIGCRMLMIDEFQHVLGPKNDRRRILLDSIKHLSNLLRIPIVLLGTTEAHSAVSKDEQLINRLPAMWMPTWKMDDEYRRLLATFEVMMPLRERTRLQNRETASLILDLSEGRIGEIRDLLCLGVEEALRQGKEHLDAAFIRSLVWVAPSKRRLQRAPGQR